VMLTAPAQSATAFVVVSSGYPLGYYTTPDIVSNIVSTERLRNVGRTFFFYVR
jgi:hypothetical protein